MHAQTAPRGEHAEPASSAQRATKCRLRAFFATGLALGLAACGGAPIDEELAEWGDDAEDNATARLGTTSLPVTSPGPPVPCPRCTLEFEPPGPHGPPPGVATAPAFCTRKKSKALYGFSLAVGVRLAEEFIEEATDADGLSCAALDTVFRRFYSFVREFRDPPCQRAGLEDGGLPILEATSCFEPPTECKTVEHPGGTVAGGTVIEGY